MPSIPGYCAACDLVFEGDDGVYIENSFNITVTGVEISCPECGEPASLASGTFSAIGNTLELVSGPPLTYEILSRLREIAERAQSHQVTPAEAVQEAKELDPVLGSIFENFVKVGIPALAVLITIIGVYLQQLSLKAQNESLAIQKRDSETAEAFYRDALQALRDQRATLEKSLAQMRDRSGITGKLDRPTTTDAAKKAVTAKEPSKRRTDVNSARRQKLIERRRMFPRRNQPS